MSDPRAVVRSIVADARKGADASVIARRTGLRPEQVITICKRRRVPITWRHPTRRHDPPSDTSAQTWSTAFRRAALRRQTTPATTEPIGTGRLMRSVRADGCLRIRLIHLR